MKNRFISLCTAISLLMTMWSMGVGMGMPSYAVASELPIAVSDFTGMLSDTSGSTMFIKTGDATVTGSALRLTPNTVAKTGTVVRRNQIKLNGGFSTFFKVKMDGNYWR